MSITHFSEFCKKLHTGRKKEKKIAGAGYRFGNSKAKHFVLILGFSINTDSSYFVSQSIKFLCNKKHHKLAFWKMIDEHFSN